MERLAFEQLVAQGIAQIPERFRRLLKNVAIVIEDQPTLLQLRKSKIDRRSLLLGLYEGVPKTHRFGQDPLLPDKITIFRKSVEAVAHSPADIRQVVAETIWHEIGHYFGLSEHAVRQAETRRTSKQA